MADSIDDPEASAARDRESPPRVPRWVLWPGIVIGLLLLVFLVLQLTGVHGPPAGGH
jgi:hypothetical protein